MDNFTLYCTDCPINYDHIKIIAIIHFHYNIIKSFTCSIKILISFNRIAGNVLIWMLPTFLKNIFEMIVRVCNCMNSKKTSRFLTLK